MTRPLRLVDDPPVPRHDALPPRRVRYLPRRPRNGHHADCPTPHLDAEHCGPCAGMRKGRRT